MDASSRSNEQVTLMVDIHVASENVEQFLAGLKISYDGVAAEPECIFYDLFVDEDDPGHLRIVEVWNASHDWMQIVQLEKSYYGPYLEKTTPLWTAPRQIHYWTRQPGFAFHKQIYTSSSTAADPKT